MDNVLRNFRFNSGLIGNSRVNALPHTYMYICTVGCVGHVFKSGECVTDVSHFLL